MKTKIISLVAMCGTALSPIMSTVAYADTVPEPTAAAASSVTLADMQDQCDLLADGYDTGNGDRWEGTVVLGAVTKVSGPTEVANSRVIDTSTIAHAGTYVPATLEIRGDPFRIGGSVNMFGDQWSTAGYWTDSTYTFTADYASTFSHAFSCSITQALYHPAYTVHVEAVGEYVPYGDFGDSEDAVRGNCASMTAKGYPIERRPEWWGVDEFIVGSDDKPHCQFDGTLEHDEERPASWDAPVERYVIAGTPINQDQTDSLTAFEDHGGPVQVTGAYHVGQTVICISPSTSTKKGVPGAWRPQNGYSGLKCTTDWFKVAPWGAGTESSNGTYISVPNYTL